jgi:hypothetical protein
MDLATIEKQVNQSEDRLSAYDANLPSEIESQIKKAGSPLIKESLGVTKDLMGDYLGRFFDVTSMGPGMQGTTAKDLSPTQKLGVMGRELGTMAGSLNAAQGYTDYLGGQINDMYGKAVQAAQLGQQNLADEYSRLMQRYQMAWQEAENAKNRAATSGPGGLSLNMGDYQGESEQPNVQAPDRGVVIDRIKAAANQLASMRGKGPGRYTLGGQVVGNIDDAHKLLLNQAAQYGVILNPEWLWGQLGNDVGRVYSVTY